MALPISLSVYDVANTENENTNDLIKKLNSVTHAIGLGGVFHGGIVVDGLEWSFGYCESGSGVYACKPKLNPMYVFRETVDLGTCLKTKQEVRDILKALKIAWPGTDYEVLTKNCNHFCEAFASELGCKSTPPWLNRMAHGADSTYTAYTNAKQTALNVYKYFWPDQLGHSNDAKSSGSGTSQDSTTQPDRNRYASSRSASDFRSSAPSTNSDEQLHSTMTYGRDSHESMFARRGTIVAPSNQERPESTRAMASNFSAPSLFARQAVVPDQRTSQGGGNNWAVNAAAAAAAATRAAEELKQNLSLKDESYEAKVPQSTNASKDHELGKHILDM